MRITISDYKKFSIVFPKPIITKFSPEATIASENMLIKLILKNNFFLALMQPFVLKLIFFLFTGLSRLVTPSSRPQAVQLQ